MPMPGSGLSLCVLCTKNERCWNHRRLRMTKASLRVSHSSAKTQVSSGLGEAFLDPDSRFSSAWFCRNARQILCNSTELNITFI